MANIRSLQLLGLRNLQTANCELVADLVVISGHNGAGKTAVLEAIYLLATGRSFREHRLQKCQQWQSEQMTVFARVETQQGMQSLGWQRRSQQTDLKINGATVSSQVAIAQHIPVLVFAPDYQSSWVQGPAERRKLIDWGAFYAYPDFLSVWQGYHHALKQRNHALKQQLSSNEIRIWHKPLGQYAERLTAIRQDYVQNLAVKLADYVPKLSDDLLDLSLYYALGWSSDVDLLNHWENSLEADRQLGYTQVGPHRADLKIRIAGRDALSVLSRGQQKLLAMMLVLAQADQLQLSIGETPILLLDDLSAELDDQHLKRVLILLSELNCQCFLTTTDASLFQNFITAGHWYLEQGVISVQP